MQKPVYEFISQQTSDPIVERKTCTVSGEPFAIFQSDLDFYEKISPTFNGKKYAIPTPTLCPQERQRRRLSFVNNHKLYKRQCDLSHKSFISCYSPDKTYKVYTRDVWFGDNRNAIQYAQDFKHGETFSSQLNNLIINVPHIGLYGFNEENSEYNNGFIHIKNCYLCFTVDYLEDCLYCYNSQYLSKCVDCELAHHCELSYDCYNVNGCFDLQYSSNCENCANSMFLNNCSLCKDSFMCMNLQNQQYCIFNKQYTKEEYELKKKDLLKKDINVLLQEFDEFVLQNIEKSFYGHNNQHSIGNYIYDSKNAVMCSNVSDVEDCKYCRYTFKSKDCYDLDIFGDGSTRLYEATRTGLNEHNVCFSFAVRTGCVNIFYSLLMVNCKNCFACIGLQNKEYCILNKQYTKAEYEELVPQIIEHMRGETSALGVTQTGERGEFFPSSLSPFGYNETLAQEYFPLTKEQAIEKGFKWSDYESPFPKTDAKDVVICEVSGKPFRLIPQEIEFYKKHNLPSPTKHPDIRHADRLAQRPGRELFLRTCDKCGIQLLSVYIQESKFKVYCEACYNKEIYG